MRAIPRDTISVIPGLDLLPSHMAWGNVFQRLVAFATVPVGGISLVRFERLATEASWSGVSVAKDQFYAASAVRSWHRYGLA